MMMDLLTPSPLLQSTNYAQGLCFRLSAFLRWYPPVIHSDVTHTVWGYLLESCHYIPF